jgi:nicotinamidase-related amidase
VLDTLLRGLGTQTVILTGVSTNVALPGTTIEATNRGYSVVVPEDCTAGGSPETHEFMIREFFPLLSAVTTAEAVLAALRAPG